MEYDFRTIKNQLIEYLNSEYAHSDVTPDNLDLSSGKDLYTLTKVILERIKNNESVEYLLLEFESKYNSKTKIRGNWWEWRIGIPYNYLQICLLLNTHIETCDKTLNKFVRKFAKHGDLTYANQASICKNLFILGVLTENLTYINEALTNAVKAFKPVVSWKAKFANKLQAFCVKHPKFPHPVWMFRWKEGLYPDLTFIQHTSVPYIGTYGKEMLQFASLILSCDVDLPQKITEILQSWIDAFLLNMYDNQIMLMSCGRQANNIDPFSEFDSVNKYIKHIKSKISITSHQLESFLKFQESGNRVIYQSPDFRFCIAGSSKEVAPYEGFNGDNLNGANQCLGATYIYKPGDKNYTQGYYSRVGYNAIPGTLLTSEVEYKESKHPLFNYNKDTFDLLQFTGLNNEFHMQYYSNEFGIVNKYWSITGNSIICSGTSEKPSQCVVDNRINANLLIYDYGVFDANAKIEYAGDFEVKGTQILTKKSLNYYYIIKIK